MHLDVTASGYAELPGTNEKAYIPYFIIISVSDIRILPPGALIL